MKKPNLINPGPEHHSPSSFFQLRNVERKRLLAKWFSSSDVASKVDEEEDVSGLGWSLGEKN